MTTSAKGDREITLQFLGAGGAFSCRYGTTCSMLTLSGSERWLIDCGRQAPDQITAEGLTWDDIDGQIITHVHGDHIYGLEDFDGNLTRAHLQSPTPYNTYTRNGLPPGPIANPGRASLRAVMNPPSVDYLFFVSRNDGSHQFSRTLAEHNRAVAHFQRGRGRAPRKSKGRPEN